MNLAGRCEWQFRLLDGGAGYDSNYGGYQAIVKGAEVYGAATEMRKDGLALAY